LASALVSVQASGAGVVIVPLSDVLLSDLMTLQFVTLNLQVTDNWGQGQLLVEEWLVPA